MNESNLKSGDEGVITYKSANPFEFFHILNSKDYEEQDMYGTLVFPEKKKKQYPLVICMHGSLGWRGHHHEHSVNYLNNGFAIFRVSSFDARQVISIVEDQMQVTLATTLTDCFGALKMLSKHPDIDEKNIFIAGWSLGGSTALYSAWEPLAEKLAPKGERFAGHIAFYPGAFIWPGCGSDLYGDLFYIRSRHGQPRTRHVPLATRHFSNRLHRCSYLYRVHITVQDAQPIGGRERCM